MDLKEIFNEIKKKFSPRKDIDFEEYGFHFEVEPLTSQEETIIMESIQDIDGAQYLEALKRHTLACALKKINKVEIGDEVKYMDEESEEKIKSHFLFMKDYVSGWPTILIDSMFEAYTNMLIGIQKNLKDGIKFERVEITEKVKEETPPSELQEVKEDSNAGLTETERLNKKVEKEIYEEDIRMAKVKNENIKS